MWTNFNNNDVTYIEYWTHYCAKSDTQCTLTMIRWRDYMMYQRSAQREAVPYRTGMESQLMSGGSSVIYCCHSV